MADKIGIIDADLMDNGTRHPNLALMKISGYHKELGDTVELICDGYARLEEYDIVFISKVFNFTHTPDAIEKTPNVVIGGTGFFEDGGDNLPEEVEHHKPDYHLYDDYVNKKLSEGASRTKYADYLDYSIGFATRGCFRKCSFCVNKKYDHAVLHSPLSEFLDEDRPYIYLWDDNIFAYPGWKKVFDELNASGKPFQFRQGIDIRLLNEEKADVLVNSHNRGDYIFAFDHIEDRKLIANKLEIWKRYSSRVSKLYVLCAFDSQDEIDIKNTFERIKIIMQHGCLPYIMRYELYKKSKYKDIYIQLARWCNQPQFFKKKSFRQFCIANQSYKKNQSTNCSAYQSMLDFEAEHPNIAGDYFDLKFETLNKYKNQYGYGRRYANKWPCNICIEKGLSWDQLMDKDDETLIRMYLTKEIDLQCLNYSNVDCEHQDEYISRIISIIEGKSIAELVSIIKHGDSFEPVTQENIPQISNLDDAIKNVNALLDIVNKEMTFEEVGFYLERDNGRSKNGKEPNKVAKRKYGENHCKMAALLDFVYISKNNVKTTVVESTMGIHYKALPDEMKENIAIKLCLRIPIIRNYYIEGEKCETITRDLRILSESTQKRRRSTVINVVRSIEESKY